MVRTRAGYAGGTKNDPTYHALGDHTESLQVDYDPERISFEEVLDHFWAAHDPTQQSLWTQYKTILFFDGPEQERVAEESRARLERVMGRAIRTEVRPLDRFYQAEDYHQKYRLRHAKGLMAEFRAMYPVDADFVRSTAAARVNGYLDGYGDLRQLEREIDGLGLSREMAASLHELVARRDRAGREEAVEKRSPGGRSALGGVIRRPHSRE